MKKIVLISILSFIGLSVIFSGLRRCSDLNNTLHKEFDASALLKKYEYFKDLSAGIDKCRADIEVYESEIQTINPSDDQFYLQQRKSELLGIISMHNKLCSEYNSAMAKFNYRFTNVGGLPESNLEPLPREYKPYINSINSK